MRSVFRRRLMVVAAIVAQSAALASAQTPAPAATPVHEVGKKADELYQEGVSAVKQQKWAEAAAKFEAAFLMNPSYDVATNLGNTEYRLGKFRNAAEHLAFALRSWPLSAKLDQREAATKKLTELRTLVASVTIRVSAPDAAVFVDGKQVGRSPLPAEVFVEPGPKVIEVKLAGFEDAKQSIQAAKGSAQEISITLVPAKSVGGIAPLDPGNGTVKPPGDGRGDAPMERGPSKPLIIAGVVSSATLVAAGVVFAIVSNTTKTNAGEQQASLLQDGGGTACRSPSALADRCAELDSNLATAETLGNLSVWSFIGGGVLGAGTAIYVLAVPKAKPIAGKPKSKAHVLPLVLAQGGGLVLVGDW